MLSRSCTTISGDRRHPGASRVAGSRRGTIRISERAASRPEPKKMTIAPQTMTLAEFLARHENDPVLEYAQGVVIEKTAPAWNHGILAYFIAKWINDYAHSRQLALAIPELRSTDRLAGISRVPDIAVYVWDRIERDPLAQFRGAFVPPDIAIAIASPGQSSRKQIERC